MYTATIDNFKIKQDEMLRQAENYRLIQAAQKTNSPSLPSPQITQDRNQPAVSSLSSQGFGVNIKIDLGGTIEPSRSISLKRYGSLQDLLGHHRQFNPSWSNPGSPRIFGLLHYPQK